MGSRLASWLAMWRWRAQERAAIGTGRWHELACPFCRGANARLREGRRG